MYGLNYVVEWKLNYAVEWKVIYGELNDMVESESWARACSIAPAVVGSVPCGGLCSSLSVFTFFFS